MSLEDRELVVVIAKSFSKCESMYGNGVRDFDENNAGALTIFK